MKHNTPFIAVEGPIGVGKTSLSRAISEEFSIPHLKEIVDENPFLGKFYDNIDEWSFQTEMFFLCNRYKQLEDINNQHLSIQTPVVSDYHILKNIVFAERTLKPQQFQKYIQIYDILTKDMIAPNVVIYLHASLETLLNRIKIRGREIERNIDPHYLEQLIEDYDNTMKKFEEENPSIPLIRINGDDFDFVQNPDHLQIIMEKVKETLKNKELTLG